MLRPTIGRQITSEPVMSTSPDCLQPNKQELMPAVDHVGIVAYQLQPLVDAFTRLGFRVSRPEPLYGTHNGEKVSLGQHSAHIVLSNFYIEISAPEPGRNDNHLVSYLEQYGPGTRIVALACEEAASAHAAMAACGLGLSDVLDANRSVEHADGSMARFRWFSAIADTNLSALTCWVQQLTPELVFHPAGRTASWTAHSASAVMASCYDPETLLGQLESWARAAGADSQAPRLFLRQDAGSNREHHGAAVVDRLLLASSDLPRYRQYLDEMQVGYTEDNDSLWVPLPGFSGLQLGFVGSLE